MIHRAVLVKHIFNSTLQLYFEPHPVLLSSQALYYSILLDMLAYDSSLFIYSVNNFTVSFLLEIISFLVGTDTYLLYNYNCLL